MMSMAAGPGRWQLDQGVVHPFLVHLPDNQIMQELKPQEVEEVVLLAVMVQVEALVEVVAMPLLLKEIREVQGEVEVRNQG